MIHRVGGCPSPIFPNGKLCSLPIPDCDSNITYDGIRYGNMNMGEIVEDLTRRRQPQNRIGRKSRAHLDPDINASDYPRQEDWQPLFGQCGHPQEHLRNQCVVEGDLFLFFGLFREVKEAANGWWYVKGTQPRHILWGWLQIGEIRKVNELAKDELPWARYHPHLQYPKSDLDKTLVDNTLYVASDRLDLDHSFKGAGRFPKFHEQLVLTDPEGLEVTDWRLPRCFYPDEGKYPLTHFPDPNSNWIKMINTPMHIAGGRDKNLSWISISTPV